MSTAETPCPLCGTPLSQTRYAEIQRRVRDEERAKLKAHRAKLETDFKQRLRTETETARRQGARESKRALETAQAERSKLAEKLAKTEAQEATLRAQHSRDLERKDRELARKVERAQSEAAKSAKLKADQRVSEVVANNKELAGEVSKLRKAADQVRAKALRQAQREHKDALAAIRKQHQEEVAEQRTALEDHARREAQKAQAQTAAEKAKWQKKVDDLKHQLEKKSAHELGEWPEVDLHQELRDGYQDDKVTRIDKGVPGADVRHEIRHNGQQCGLILYDSKNRKQWRWSFVEKLRQDKIDAGADYAILATSTFPAEHKDMFLKDGVLVAKPIQALALAGLLREHTIRIHTMGLSLRDRDAKKERLYEYIVSDSYRRLMDTADTFLRDLEQVDVDDDDQHRKLLQRRGLIRRSLQKLLREATTEITAILETPTPIEEDENYQSVKPAVQFQPRHH